MDNTTDMLRTRLGGLHNKYISCKLAFQQAHVKLFLADPLHSACRDVSRSSTAYIGAHCISSSVSR